MCWCTGFERNANKWNLILFLFSWWFYLLLYRNTGDGFLLNSAQLYYFLMPWFRFGLDMLGKG